MPFMGVGNHICKVVNATMPDVDEGKTPSVCLTFRNEAGEHIDAYLYLSEKALARTEKSLRACGWVGDDVSELMRDGVDLKQVEVVVEEEEYNGKVRAKVKWINAIRKAMEADKAKELAMSLRKKFKGVESEEEPF